MQNLAKQRAREFGRTDVIETLKPSAAVQNNSASSTSAVVVTSKANEVELGRANPHSSDALESRPRGFFADQFEVSHVYIGRLPELNYCNRTEAISKRIMRKRVPRYGGKQMGTSMHSFLAPVGALRDLPLLAADSFYTLGTGGTIAGIGRYLKDMEDKILVVLSDPEGSGLYNKV